MKQKIILNKKIMDLNTALKRTKVGESKIIGKSISINISQNGYQSLSIDIELTQAEVLQEKLKKEIEKIKRKADALDK
jgi:hypothetical protein